MILIEEKNKYEFDDLFNCVVETEDKFLNKKLNSNICFGGKGGGGKQQDIAPTLQPYVRDVLSRAKGEFAADQPYQAYPGERVVSFTPQELAAQQGIQQMAGQYGLASMAPGLTSSAAYYGPAYSYLGQTGQALGQQAGALAEAPRLFGTQEALYGEALRPISGIQQQLTGAGALLGEAGMRQRAAARDIGRDEIGRFALTGEDIQQYMDPYQQAVIDIEKKQAQQDALQTAQAIAAKSAGAGAFGGSRQAILESQAASDLAKRLSDIQTRGSQAAYQQALQTAAQQQQIGLGQAAQQRAREQQLGAGLAGLAGARQQLGVGGYGSMAEQLRQAGAGFGGLGGQYGQLAGQYGQLGGGLGALSGQYGALGQQALGQGYRELGYLSGVGEAQRGLGQQRADVAYQEFLEQRDFPAKQLQQYAGMAFGVPSGYLQQQQAQPSTFQQLAGAGLALGGLGRGLQFFKEGGNIGEGGLSTVYRQEGSAITNPIRRFFTPSGVSREEEILARKERTLAQALASNSGVELAQREYNRALRDLETAKGRQSRYQEGTDIINKEEINRLEELLKNSNFSSSVKSRLEERKEKLQSEITPEVEPEVKTEVTPETKTEVKPEVKKSSVDKLEKAIEALGTFDKEAAEKQAKLAQGLGMAELGFQLMTRPAAEVQTAAPIAKIVAAQKELKDIPRQEAKAYVDSLTAKLGLKTLEKELYAPTYLDYNVKSRIIDDLAGPAITERNKIEPLVDQAEAQAIAAGITDSNQMANFIKNYVRSLSNNDISQDNTGVLAGQQFKKVTGLVEDNK